MDDVIEIKPTVSLETWVKSPDAASAVVIHEAEEIKKDYEANPFWTSTTVVGGLGAIGVVLGIASHLIRKNPMNPYSGLIDVALNLVFGKQPSQSNQTNSSDHSQSSKTPT